MCQLLSHLKLFIAASLVILSSTSFGAMGFYSIDNNLPAFAAKVEHATVAVYSRNPNGSGKLPIGTAVLIAVKQDKKHLIGYFLTNSHVVESWSMGSTGDGPEIYYHYRYTILPGAMGSSSMPSSLDGSSWNSSVKSVIKVRTKKEDHDIDLAVFTATVPLEYGVEGALPEITDWHVSFNTNADNRVVAIGNPSLATRWGQNSAFDQNGKSIGNNIRETFWSQGNALYETHYKVNKIDQATLVHDADMLPGMSGGPLINAQGQLVGINRNITVPKNSNEYQYNSSFGCGSVPAASIAKFLRDVKF